jgi:hypothetical protein
MYALVFEQEQLVQEGSILKDLFANKLKYENINSQEYQVQLIIV